MQTINALKREIAIVSKALAVAKPAKTIHKIVFVDPVTEEPVPDSPPFYCYTGFTEKERLELIQQHDKHSFSET